YDKKANKARHIRELIAHFEKYGTAELSAACDEETKPFTAEEWRKMSEKEQQLTLLHYRLTYLADAVVNWCPALGTVLANDEVKDGFSERGGYPVERKKMRQWMMRITAYADRLQENLKHLDWSEAVKEMQRNWIGKSYGCELDFKVVDKPITLTVFTTRPDTIFGVTYLVIAPEHELIPQLTTPEQKAAVEEYVTWAKNRSERERMAEVKTVSGVFTGSYVINPLNGEKVPLWIADYVLAGYGTGVVMAVPSSDDRDFRFAKHFQLPIKPVIEGTEHLENPTEKKHGIMINSGFLNGLRSEEAIQVAIKKAVELGVGKPKVNYKMRDAVFSRQRYWGEPVPVYFKDGIPYLIDEKELPLALPKIDQYKPTATGEPPLARAASTWKYQGKYDYEHTTMPGWAGSSWYFLRYMDAQNDQAFVSKEAADYWNVVDLYIGGTEHATGHLLYSRFWNMFLYDMGFISHEEPFQKLVNQGMIQGVSALIYKRKDKNVFVSCDLVSNPDDYLAFHVEISLVKEGDALDIEQFKKWRPEYAHAEFVLSDGQFKCARVVEKMSKSKYNVVNPDEVIQTYGADTLRLYEMFLGPLEQSKPWDTHGIDGTFRFLRKLWRLFYDDKGNYLIRDEVPTKEELKILHKTIKKTEEDIESLSFNTAVSAFMVCVNELHALKCHKKAILSDLLVILSPFAPHITEELWQTLHGYRSFEPQHSIINARFPKYNPDYLVEESFEYPISINGKLRTKITFPLDMSVSDIEKNVLSNDVVQKWLEGKAPKKIIVVPKKIVNVVV
ncbi:MAG: leucine--tRNA ligase, partial [Flammeovirgaceae bacterium]|nr:leucine--tRNA ligase [Flammeovirgaceae bacterium]MDW8287210.1 leucine--tRNA ligase [Flammeovirgaceae bacterium]